jgi:maltose O-acetyltransferase
LHYAASLEPTDTMTPAKAAKRWLARLFTRAGGALVADPLPHASVVASQGGFSAMSRLVGACEGEAAVALLRQYGATIGARAMIHHGVTIVNAESGFANLTMGDGCHVGHDVLLDLTNPIVIEDRVTVTMRSMLLTHLNAGESQAEAVREIRHAPIRLMQDVYIGAGAIVLPGVSIGRGAVVAAGAVVTRDVPDGAVVAGMPAKPLVHR